MSGELYGVPFPRRSADRPWGNQTTAAPERTADLDVAEDAAKELRLQLVRAVLRIKELEAQLACREGTVRELEAHNAEMAAGYPGVDPEYCDAIVEDRDTAWSIAFASFSDRSHAIEGERRWAAEARRLRDADELVMELDAKLLDVCMADRWIPVSERYPEKGETVQAYCGRSRPGNYAIIWQLTYRGFCEEHQDHVWQTEYGRNRYDVASHWRPLPYPPEGE